MNENNTIRELLPEDRPYEKCLASGTESLTDTELLAVIIRTGTKGMSAVALADRILNLSCSNEGLLGICHLSRQELMELPGIGLVKAIQIKCIGELSKRIATKRARKALSFTQPLSIADYYMEQLRHEEQEQMICMMLDTKNHFIGDEIISRGTVNASLISPREIFLLALRYHAVHLILIHNHPSGDATPSEDDRILTRRICEAGDLLGISVLDHIIIGDHQYMSFREEKYL
ncbi:MAG: DNA repair protein RadC [Lachnospiraceae bacterium]|nr:DNA repair protein RadC [Lachnospiraceae bacterium]